MFQWFTGKVAYLSTWLGFKIGCGVVKALPRTVFWTADCLAVIGHRCFRSFRRRSVANIGVALGGRLDAAAIDALARRSLRNFFRCCVELLIAINSPEDEFRDGITVVGRENLEAALAKGNGVIVLSAHLGNFFLLGSRLAVYGHATFVLVNQPREGRFEPHVVQDSRQGSVDVDSHRLDLFGYFGGDRLHQANTVSSQPMLPGEVEQHRCPRILRMDAVTKAGDALADRSMLGHDCRGTLFERQ